MLWILTNFSRGNNSVMLLCCIFKHLFECIVRHISTRVHINGFCFRNTFMKSLNTSLTLISFKETEAHCFCIYIHSKLWNNLQWTCWDVGKHWERIVKYVSRSQSLVGKYAQQSLICWSKGSCMHYVFIPNAESLKLWLTS